MAKIQNSSKQILKLNAVPTETDPGEKPLGEDRDGSQTDSGSVGNSASDPLTKAAASNAPASEPGNPVPTSLDSAPPAFGETSGTANKPVVMSVPSTLRTGAVTNAGLRRMPARPMHVVDGPAAVRPKAEPADAPMQASPENRPGGVVAAAGPLPPPDKMPPPATPTVETSKPVAAAARIRPRHRGILASFVAFVLLPLVVTATYLWVVAVDQYASTVGFSVRTERVSSALDILGGITRLSGGGSSDSDILYDYIHSQELVTELDAEIDLRAIYSKAWPNDPIFAFDPDGSVEDLLDHWKKKVRIIYDSSTGLMTLRVLAFSREEATLIATAILKHSTDKINDLAAESHEDATNYARSEMERALERLKGAREAMTGFRMRTQMVDPIADLQGQMGILNSFQAQLAQSYVELDLLRATTTGSDPRILQAEQRITVIRNRMEEERLKFGENGKGPGGEDYATMVAEFERLSVDREFAEQAYRIALAAYDAAQAEAQRKSRYLAAHVLPTQADESEYPQRWTLLSLTGFFLLMAWAIAVLVYYSIRDRR